VKLNPHTTASESNQNHAPPQLRPQLRNSEHHRAAASHTSRSSSNLQITTVVATAKHHRCNRTRISETFSAAHPSRSSHGCTSFEATTMQRTSLAPLHSHSAPTAAAQLAGNPTTIIATPSSSIVNHQRASFSLQHNHGSSAPHCTLILVHHLREPAPSRNYQIHAATPEQPPLPSAAPSAVIAISISIASAETLILERENALPRVSI